MKRGIKGNSIKTESHSLSQQDSEEEKGKHDSLVEVNLLVGGGGVVFGDGLGAFRDGMLGKFTGEDQTDSGLDFSGGEGSALVNAGKATSFGGNAVESVVDERVHDGHGALRDTSLGVDLLENFVDVRAIGFSSFDSPLSDSTSLGSLLDSLSSRSSGLLSDLLGSSLIGSLVGGGGLLGNTFSSSSTNHFDLCSLLGN